MDIKIDGSKYMEEMGHLPNLSFFVSPVMLNELHAFFARPGASDYFNIGVTGQGDEINTMVIEVSKEKSITLYPWDGEDNS